MDNGSKASSKMMFLLLLKKSLKLLLPLLLIVDNAGNVAAMGKFDDHFFQPLITKPLPSSNSNYNNNNNKKNGKISHLDLRYFLFRFYYLTSFRRLRIHFTTA